MTLADIKNKLIPLKPELHTRFGVSEIGVFGSWVRGEQKDTSDIDVLVDFDKPIDLFDLMGRLLRIFGRSFDRKFDIACMGKKPFTEKHMAGVYSGSHVLSLMKRDIGEFWERNEILLHMK